MKNLIPSRIFAGRGAPPFGDFKSGGPGQGRVKMSHIIKHITVFTPRSSTEAGSLRAGGNAVALSTDDETESDAVPMLSCTGDDDTALS